MRFPIIYIFIYLSIVSAFPIGSTIIGRAPVLHDYSIDGRGINIKVVDENIKEMLGDSASVNSESQRSGLIEYKATKPLDTSQKARLAYLTFIRSVELDKESEKEEADARLKEETDIFALEQAYARRKEEEEDQLALGKTYARLIKKIDAEEGVGRTRWPGLPTIKEEEASDEQTANNAGAKAGKAGLEAEVDMAQKGRGGGRAPR